jgi:hypothetical protein
MKFSSYTSAFNLIKMGFDWQNSILNYSQFMDEVVIAINASEDNTFESVSKFLEEKGIAITIKPLFDDAYLDALYSKKKQNPLQILKYYIQRFLILFTVFNYDKVVIEKELFPYFFSWFESILNGLGVKYVVDYDDAIFHNYDLSNNKLISFFFKNKIDTVMKNCHAVIAGNSYLSERAKASGAKSIIVIPTVIDINQYHIKDNYDSNQVVIGWIGSPSTLKYLKPLVPVF